MESIKLEERGSITCLVVMEILGHVSDLLILGNKTNMAEKANAKLVYPQCEYNAVYMGWIKGVQ